jgi:Mrp family chromosome partitioning ATPase
LPKTSHVSDPSQPQAVIAEPLREPVRSLRTNLQLASLDRPLHTLLVTSAVAAEGKSTVVRNIALAYQEAGLRVAVVEADLRRPVLADFFKIRARPGLTDVLAGESEIGEALQGVSGSVALAQTVGEKVQSAVHTNGTSRQLKAAGSLTVLTSGPKPPNPPSVLAAARVRSLFDEIAQDYDIVLIDSAPLLAVSDAVPLLTQVDGVVLVGRLGSSRRETARRVMELLRRIPDANVLGIVANGMDKSELAAGYGYGYGYDHE